MSNLIKEMKAKELRIKGNWVRDHFKKKFNDLEEQDRKFPNRHKEIHKGCCKHCPSDHNRRNGTIDPETADIDRLPKEIIAKEYVFVCAWRPNKLCKGICDFHGINEEFISNLKET